MMCIEENTTGFDQVIREEATKYERKTVNLLGHVTVLLHEYLRKQSQISKQFYSNSDSGMP